MNSHFFAVPAVRLTGRVDLLDSAADLLEDEEDVALLGIGGSGKSAIAAALARSGRVRAHLDGGVLWLGVGRGGVGAASCQSQLIDWAQELGATKDRIRVAHRSGTEALVKLVGDQLGDSATLLVFDDLWDPRESTLFRQLGVNCRRVITTRMPGVASAFSAGGVVRVDDLSESEAQTLFARIAPSVVTLAPEVVDACLDAVGRLPLVVVIAASYLESNLVANDPTVFDDAVENVKNVRERFKLNVDLARVTMPGLDTAATLEAVIDLTVDSLTDEHRKALASLAAFPPKLNSFSWKAADAVVASHEAVVNLRQNGLLDDAGELSRLSMHQTIHDYATRGVEGDAETYARMADYFVQFIEEQKDSGSDAETWLVALEQERENILAALEFLLDRGSGILAFRLMGGLWDYWYRRAHYVAAGRYADRVLEMPISDESREFLLLKAKVLNDAGNFAYNVADLEKAERRHLAALELRERFDDDSVAASWNNLGLIARERGEYTKSIDYLQRAMERNIAVKKRDWQAMNLDNLGIVQHRLGEMDDARSSLVGSKSIFEELGDRWGVAMSSVDLARALASVGEVDAAGDLLVRTLSDRWKAGDPKLSAAALLALAQARCLDDAVRMDDLVGASMALSVSIVDRLGVHHELMALLRLASERSDHLTVAAISGVLRELRDRTGLKPSPADQAKTSDLIKKSRSDLGDRFTTAESAGRAMATTDEGDLDVERAVTRLIGSVEVDEVVESVLASAGL